MSGDVIFCVGLVLGVFSCWMVLGRRGGFGAVVLILMLPSAGFCQVGGPTQEPVRTGASHFTYNFPYGCQLDPTGHSWIPNPNIAVMAAGVLWGGGSGNDMNSGLTQLMNPQLPAALQYEIATVSETDMSTAGYPTRTVTFLFHNADPNSDRHCTIFINGVFVATLYSYDGNGQNATKFSISDITTRTVCAGVLNPTGGPCDADSGGYVTWDGYSGQWSPPFPTTMPSTQPASQPTTLPWVGDLRHSIFSDTEQGSQEDGLLRQMVNDDFSHYEGLGTGNLSVLHDFMPGLGCCSDGAVKDHLMAAMLYLNGSSVDAAMSAQMVVPGGSCSMCDLYGGAAGILAKAVQGWMDVRESLSTMVGIFRGVMTGIVCWECCLSTVRIFVWALGVRDVDRMMGAWSIVHQLKGIGFGVNLFSFLSRPGSRPSSDGAGESEGLRVEHSTAVLEAMREGDRLGLDIAGIASGEVQERGRDLSGPWAWGGRSSGPPVDEVVSRRGKRLKVEGWVERSHKGGKGSR